MQHYSKLSHREVFQVVAVSNEEDTIVLILVAQLGFVLFSPAVRLVTPVAFPLASAPRIAHLQHSEGTTFVVNLVRRQDSVGMRLNNTTDGFRVAVGVLIAASRNSIIL